jgi:peptidyl-dipeptidase A
LHESHDHLAERLQEEIQSLEIAFHEAYWDSQIEATEANERRRSEMELELRRVKGDAESLAAVEDALASDIHNATVHRMLTVLRLSLTGNRMDEDRRAEIVSLSSAVESEFANHRPEIHGKRVTDNDIEVILRTSDDHGLRQSAWEASKEIGGVVADRVRELARLRNQAALDLGRSDHYSFALELQEMDERWLFALLDEVERLTDEPFRRWKASLDGELTRRFGTSDLYPWHYADPFFQQLPPDGRVSLDDELADSDPAELARRTFDVWGIDISGVVEGSDLYPREGKCQHAFCLDVDRSAKNVRILANIVPGERWTEVMLHESGHAAYDVSIDPDLPYVLRRATHTFTTEAMAILSGRLVRDPEWLRTVRGLPASQVDAVADGLASANSAQMLLFARWALVMAHFERAMYADPESDLNSLWWELVERFQLLQRPPDRDAPDWAAKIHTAVAPVYYHNYLLGEILASQLEDTARSQAGGLVGVPEAGALLVDRVFRPGALLRWDALVEAATGGALDPRPFVASAAG